MKSMFYALALVALCNESFSAPNSESIDSLAEAIDRALLVAPKVKSLQADQSAYRAAELASDRLPNPEISLQLANLPIDSFSFAQEPMTQVQLGIVQPLNRGDTVELQQQVWRQKIVQSEMSLLNYRAEVKLAVSSLWFELYRVRQQLLIVEKTKALYAQALQIVNARYASAIGSARQSNVLQSQLELSRLDDDLLRLKQREQSIVKALKAWMGDDDLANVSFDLHKQKPSINIIQQELIGLPSNEMTPLLLPLLNQHPKVQQMQQQSEIYKTQSHIAEQAHQPQWKVSASYGHRQDDLNGMPRDDFFSVGVRFDLPIFNRSQTDQVVESARYQVQSTKYQVRDLIKTMLSEALVVAENYQWNEQRQDHFQKTLLTQAEQHAEAALTAYTNDDGSFSDALAAQAQWLKLRLQQLDLEVEQLKYQAQWNYFVSNYQVRQEQSNTSNNRKVSTLEMNNE